MHSRISDDGLSGKTVAEFPILYYVVGKIWSVTGVQFWIYRLIMALWCLAALICLYRILLRLTNNSWFLSALGPVLLMCSPVYAFYGIGFLTNVPALNCVIIAWYFLMRYYQEQKFKHVLWASFFFAFGGLLKTSALESYLVLLLILALEFFRIIKLKPDGKFFPRPWLTLAVLLLPVVITMLWYKGFVEYYCNLHYGRYSFTDPVPIWTIEYDGWNWNMAWEKWYSFTLHQVYPAFVWILSFAATAFLFLRFKKVNSFWLVSIPLLFLGHSFFTLLFYYSLDCHDYYHIDLLIYFLFVYAAISKYVSQREWSKPLKITGRTITILGTIWLLLSVNNNIYMRLFGTLSKPEYCAFFSNEGTANELEWLHEGEWTRVDYQNVADEMTRRGFDNNTVVIAANDVSFNTLLIRLHRPGFTNLSMCCADSTWTAWRIERGAELMVVYNAKDETRSINKFMEHPLFTKGDLTVFDLRPYRK